MSQVKFKQHCGGRETCMRDYPNVDSKHTGTDKTQIEFASSGEATPHQPVQADGAHFNPDGTPLEDAEEQDGHVA